LGTPPLYITEGDPAGISPELILKESSLLLRLGEKRPVYILKNSFIHEYPFARTLSTSEFYSSLGKVNTGVYSVLVSPSFRGKVSIAVGNPGIHTGALSFQIFREALKAIQLCMGDLITLPLSKEWVIASGESKFTGHTEELARVFRRKTFMLMYGKTWKVIPLTTHIPFKKVPTALKNIPWEHLLDAVVKSGLFPSGFRTAFLGLNPHAGEGGKLGNEEKEILIPAIKEWSKAGFETVGPLPADSAFLEKSFDLALACYHDQGLIPFKILEGRQGINVTLGLPFLRVSPDHGPAYSIAGKGLADSSSFQSCLEFFR